MTTSLRPILPRRRGVGWRGVEHYLRRVGGRGGGLPVVPIASAPQRLTRSPYPNILRTMRPNLVIRERRGSYRPAPTVVPRDVIRVLRGQRVMLDADLAALYQVPTKALLQAVRRNRERFPADFMFQLDWPESRALPARAGTTLDERRSRSQIVTLKRGRNPKYRPYAFTEQGVAMLSSVLRSPRAIQVNIQIMRTFVGLRELLSTHTDLARRLDALEARYDASFKVVFDAIRRLMQPPDPPKPRIGFRHPGE